MKIAPPEQRNIDRMNVRIDHDMTELLKLYAQMLGPNTKLDYVIEGALKLLFDSDKDFKQYRTSVRAGMQTAAGK